MDVRNISTTFMTDKMEETVAFYVSHFGAKVTFDTGWYVRLEFTNRLHTLVFMTPEEPGHIVGSGAGLYFRFEVDDVDAEYDRLIDEQKLPVELSLENHGWGDRGFAVKDPNGITVCIYTKHPLGPDFRQYVKE